MVEKTHDYQFMAKEGGTMNPPYLDFSDRMVTAHLNSATVIRLNQYDAELLWRLLDAHYRKGITLNRTQWNGAVAVIDDERGVNWPRIIEQHGSYTTASYRAGEIHASKDVPTIAYAVIDTHGIKEDKFSNDDEEEPDLAVCGRHGDSRSFVTLEDFA